MPARANYRGGGIQRQDQVSKPDTTMFVQTSMTPQQELNTIIDIALENEILIEEASITECPNCGAGLPDGTSVCPYCNQDQDDPSMLDGEEEKDGINAEDLGILNDEENWPEEDLYDESSGEVVEWLPPSFEALLLDYFRRRGLRREEAARAVSIVKDYWSRGEALQKFPEDLPCGNINQEILESIYLEWREIIETLESSTSSMRHPGLEIRKVGDKIIPIVFDISEGLITNRDAVSSHVKLRDQELTASALISLLRQRRENMLKILQVIIDKRRPFFEASTLEEALKSLDEAPFEQQDVVEATGITKDMVSRYFKEERVLTPHGVFSLKIFLKQRTEQAVDRRKKLISQIIEFHEKKDPPEFLSDEKIAEILESEYGETVTGRQIVNIRKSMGIPSARERKAAFLNKKC